MFSIAFDEASLKTITGMYGFGVFLGDEMSTAMRTAGDLLTAAAQANTWEVFDNPTGNLASGIHPILDSPFELEVVAEVIYSRRREYGFSGMTDSLGRYFANDPAKPYLTPALADNEQAILQLFDDAALRAWERIGSA